MISWLCYLVGVDYSKIKSGKNILLFFSLVIVFTLLLAAFGFYFAIYNTTDSVFLGVLLGLFFSLFIFYFFFTLAISFFYLIRHTANNNKKYEWKNKFNQCRLLGIIKSNFGISASNLSPNSVSIE